MMKALRIALLASILTSPALAQSPAGPSSGTGYPAGAVEINASASGTTAAVVATLAASTIATNYLCGFSYQGSDATAGQVGVVAVTGLLGGTMNFAYPTLALGATVPQPPPLTQRFSPCLPASAINTAIVVTGPALGSGATVATTNAWGYRLPN